MGYLNPRAEGGRVKRGEIECCEGEEGQIQCNLGCKMMDCPLYSTAILNFFSKWPRDGITQATHADILEEVRRLTSVPVVTSTVPHSQFVDDWNEDALYQDYWTCFYDDMLDEEWE